MTLDPPRATYAFNGDVAIAYGVVGDGPVDLVYIQGFVSHVELMWECPQAVAFFERLAEWARLIIVDRRGTGMSDRFGADELPPLEEAARDVLAVMDAVGSTRASILGHHEGGQLGAMLAALHPDRVRTLSLFETAINWRRAVERTEGRTYTDAEIADIVQAWRATYGTVAEEQQLYEVTSPPTRETVGSSGSSHDCSASRRARTRPSGSSDCSTRPTSGASSVRSRRRRRSCTEWTMSC